MREMSVTINKQALPAKTRHRARTLSEPYDERLPWFDAVMMLRKKLTLCCLHLIPNIRGQLVGATQGKMLPPSRSPRRLPPDPPIGVLGAENRATSP